MIPDITTKQFMVLGCLRGSEMTGKELRAELAKEGLKQSMPGFYQMMARLEKDKLVKGWYDTHETNGRKRRVRKYQILGSGVQVFNQVLRFLETRQLHPAMKPIGRASSIGQSKRHREVQ
ncbi:MAG: hypothetical protein DWQ01_08700 [Planctomycetota bacterium]|nr:MAG: hypothetical protein DWQ01_08700 [Planctomycetota bacterium]